MRIGIVFGCFIPLHEGHMTLIRSAIDNSDHVIIAICGKDSDRGKDFIPFRDRIRLMKEKYEGSGTVKVVAVDDEKIGMDGSFSLHNWEVWGAELFSQAGVDPYDNGNTYTWYMGEPDYKKKLGDIYRNHQMVLADRRMIPVSGTKIRSNVNENMNSIAPEFIEYLKKKGKIA